MTRAIRKVDTTILSIEQAVGAIVQLINERPTCPRQEEIEAIVARAVVPPMTVLSDAQANLLKAIHEAVAAEKAASASIYEPPVDDEAAIARAEARRERVDELADQLPTPSRSMTDVLLRAQVAYLHSDKKHGRLVGLSPDDEASDDQAAAAKLIVAVLHFAGINY